VVPTVPDTELLSVSRFAHGMFKDATSHLSLDGAKAKNSLAQTIIMEKNHIFFKHKESKL